MKKLTVHRDQKRPSLLVPEILEMGWSLQTSNLCLKDKIKVYFIIALFFFTVLNLKQIILQNRYKRKVLQQKNFWKATILLYSVVHSLRPVHFPSHLKKKQSNQKPEKYLVHLHLCLWQRAFYNGLLGKPPQRMVQKMRDWIKTKRPRHWREYITVALIFCIHCSKSGCFLWGTANAITA